MSNDDDDDEEDDIMKYQSILLVLASWDEAKQRPTFEEDVASNMLFK